MMQTLPSGNFTVLRLPTLTLPEAIGQAMARAKIGDTKRQETLWRLFSRLNSRDRINARLELRACQLAKRGDLNGAAALRGRGGMKKPVAIRARVQQVFIVDGLRKITERTATILVCDKMTWAEIYTRWGAPVRRLLGTKAFYTRKAAEVRKLGELRKLEALNYPPWHAGGRACDAARGQLQEYTKTGVLH